MGEKIKQNGGYYKASSANDLFEINLRKMC
jgi:hypothetical protein